MDSFLNIEIWKKGRKSAIEAFGRGYVRKVCVGQIFISKFLIAFLYMSKIHWKI